MSVIRAIRYIVQNPGQPDCASYNESCLDINGRKTARYWAIQNASQWGGRVIEERSDGTARVIRDYTRFSPREGEPIPQPVEDSV